MLSTVDPRPCLLVNVIHCIEERQIQHHPTPTTAASVSEDTTTVPETIQVYCWTLRDNPSRPRHCWPDEASASIDWPRHDTTRHDTARMSSILTSPHAHPMATWRRLNSRRTVELHGSPGRRFRREPRCTSGEPRPPNPRPTAAGSRPGTGRQRMMHRRRPILPSRLNRSCQSPVRPHPRLAPNSRWSPRSCSRSCHAACRRSASLGRHRPPSARSRARTLSYEQPPGEVEDAPSCLALPRLAMSLSPIGPSTWRRSRLRGPIGSAHDCPLWALLRTSAGLGSSIDTSWTSRAGVGCLPWTLESDAALVGPMGLSSK